MAGIVTYKRNHIHTPVRVTSKFEPPHDKSTKWSWRPANTQINLGNRPVWSESSLSAWRSTGSLASHWAHSEDSVQTWWIPRLIRVFAERTYHFVGFVMRQLIYIFNFLLLLYQTFDCDKVQWFLCINLRHQFLCLLLLDGNYIIDSAGSDE